jgi:hypothetical protein
MYKEVQALAGYTALIHELDVVLNDLNGGNYERTTIVECNDNANAVD